MVMERAAASLTERYRRMMKVRKFLLGIPCQLGVPQKKQEAELF